MLFNASQELGISISEPHEQPLHDIINNTIEKWDKSRIGIEEEIKPIDTIIFLGHCFHVIDFSKHILPTKANTTIICVVEEFNWLCNSHVQLAKTVALRPNLQIFDDF
ncbi:hypothetical protein ACOSQ2_032112 [Xanthoceras sorbifolium]